MKKIRINELAREVEEPSSRVIELLPLLGVSEKKTHSSSIDEDVADLVRKHFGKPVSERGPETEEIEGAEAPETEPEGELEPAVEYSRPEEPEATVEEVRVEPEEEIPEAPAPPEVRAGARPIPLRPPLAGGMPAAPPAPQPPPAAPVARPMPQAPAPPHVPARPAPTAPVMRPVHGPPPGRPAPTAPAPRTVSLPAKPLPTGPRPGQILSGPRQPFPSVTGEDAASPMPSAPRPMPPRPAPQRPSAPPQSAQSQRPMAKSGTLAGQPVARPVVPPRPDLVERLRQSQPAPKAMPGQPAPPRPSFPRPQSAPVPGQPIYRGPIRPGQPISRPGMPGAPMMGGPAGLRRQRTHPTSPARVEPAAPPPTDTQRRHQKPARTQFEREAEEGKLRPTSRRSQQAALAVNKDITISEGITVKELSEKMGVKANLVIKKLVEKKIFATINQTLDVKLAGDLARAFGAKTSQVSFEEEATQEIELAEDKKDLVRRAPVVTVMGHVDHGKTSLLDAIRSTNVADREAGGITQHIGAYQIVKDGRKVVFIDTPGHEAFTRMRARGAKVTDIVVLVVAADDGVMPQTLEAIDHARAAKVPIVVAVNKIDKPDAQPERIKQQLADRGLLAEDWGGDTVMVPVSARAKQNIELLLEMILLVADIQDLKANPTRPGVGTVLEAQLDRGRGPVATVLAQNGTLSVGDYFICGQVFGKVRAMFDDRGGPIRQAEPSTPVEVLGLDSLPDVGDTFQVVTDTAKAKQIVMYRESKAREQAMAKGARVTLDQLHEQLKEGEVKELNVILKTDVGGTAEVISDTLQKLSSDKVRIRVLHSGVGAINETDVLLASASNAIIVGFNVRPERQASALAEQEKVDIRLHTIIYELTDEIKRAMTGMLAPVFKEVYRGRAVVREVFRITKVGTVAGCMVQDGAITRDSQIRLLRDNIVVHKGRIEGLKRFKNDASEVKAGFECGISLAGYQDIKPGDVIEAFATERVAVEIV